MSKFWGGVAVVLVFALAFLATGQQRETINFTDFETECRYDRGTQADYQLKNRRLSFDGHYPINNPDSRLDHTYRVSGDRITLSIQSSPSPFPDPYWNDCKGLAVYKAQTGELSPGEYILTINHDGKEAKKQVIQVK
jgi:hypothetical protein